MTASPSPRTARWTTPALWANLVAQIGIIVTGGAVRLTGSGLGCSTWPMCEPGAFTPEFHAETSLHAFIEFGNRTLTGVLAVIALAVAYLVWKETDRPTWYRRLGPTTLIGVAAQGLIGGATVLLHLHPAVVGVHMLVSLGLVAVSTVLLAARSGRVDAWRPSASLLAGARSLLVIGGLLVAAGVIATGAGPHGGDEEHAYRYAVDPVLISKVHAWIVWAFVVVLLVCLWAVRRQGAPEAVRRTWWTLLVVTALQGLVGYVQYFTGLPELLVGLHMLGAGLLVTALAWAHVDLRGVNTTIVDPASSASPEVHGTTHARS